MNKILLLHGANLNKLGQRAVAHYGTLTLGEIEQFTAAAAQAYGLNVTAFQSNYEGALIDKIQTETAVSMGIIINPGAFTHYSYALHDALLDSALPAVEVHLSAIHTREPWRQISVTAPACISMITGKKEQGYQEAVKILARFKK